MELELAKKIFMLENYDNKENMEKDIKKYITDLRNQFPSAVVTKEFYNGRNILVRATRINNIQNYRNIENDKDELEKEEVRIKEKGINGLGENVYREIPHGKTRERERELGHNGGSERERGGR